MLVAASSGLALLALLLSLIATTLFTGMVVELVADVQDGRRDHSVAELRARLERARQRPQAIEEAQSQDGSTRALRKIIEVIDAQSQPKENYAHQRQRTDDAVLKIHVGRKSGHV